MKLEIKENLKNENVVMLSKKINILHYSLILVLLFEALYSSSSGGKPPSEEMRRGSGEQPFKRVSGLLSLFISCEHKNNIQL